MDERLEAVPVGISGELYIGGVAVGRGYNGRSEMTAERYVPDPHSEEVGARMYRTGDVCRWGADGQIEYVGRRDDQVKVRGHRIELGEVEASLRACRGVRQCAVVARADDGLSQQLVAYVVPGEEETGTGVHEWRTQLQQQLPEYMVPSVFVKMEELPLTASGKVDRRRLPEVEARRPMLGSAYVAPCTPVEEMLVGIWSEVLNVEQPGVFDNFFELGGDSIRSIQIFAKAQQAGLKFSLQQLFKHPTIRDLARATASPDADYLETSEVSEFGLISENDRRRLPLDVEDAYPLTQLQAGMIFHSEYRPAAAIYHDIFTFHIKAHFDALILQTVLRQLLARHPILRTAFDLTGFSEPLQLVRRTVAVPLQVDDLSREGSERQDELLAAWVETEKSKHFDWSQAPLVRFYVHLRSENSFQFTLSFHHSVLDGWSVASMLAEIFQHYSSLLSAESTPFQLTPPAAKFRDFVALERATLASEAGRAFWKDKLSDSGFIKIPRWHFLHQSSDAKQAHTHEVQIPSELSSRLQEVAREASVPLKSVLLAAHLQVMRLLGGQADVLTGLVSNGRPEMVDGERVLGLFLNALPLRLQMKGGTWIDLAQETFEAEREMLPFRRYPMPQMQRDQGGRLLFEAGFNFNHFHLFKSLPKFAEIELVEGDFFEATNYALTANFALDIVSSQIQLTLSYNANELSDEQITAFGNYYIRALDAIASNPSARYERTNLLTAGEQHQLLKEWNDTRREYPVRCLHELFEQQVECSPEAIALVFADQELSYRELNERANQLAHHLRGLGVRAESLVGIMMERSVEMVVSLLAVLKAGGAYVPLDPEYPQERLSFMLSDSAVKVLLTQERLLGVMPASRARVVCVDTEWEVIAERSVENPESNVDADNLAYVIYTSGSTGQPNGVLIQHHNICNLIHHARSLFQMDEHSRLLHVASFSFDASLLELFLAFTSGARLSLSSHDERLSAERLSTLIEREQLTRAVLTPTLLKVLEEERCQSLRLISSGAERLTAEVAQRWVRGGRRVLNCYGPTEATVFATSEEWEREGREQEREPGIGRGVANAEVYVLDEEMRLVPTGVVGELYIGGAGVGRGYLSRPGLTGERFVPDPYSEQVGARMYRTGDMVRWSSAGELEYVGRRDEQVKIRGHRVELGEVEAEVRGLEGVKECVVVAREGRDGEQTLFAYVVADKLPSPGHAAKASAENNADGTKDESYAFLNERVELCPSVAEYFVYDDYLYGTLTHDYKRNDSYRAVINRSVRNKVVLDLGTGPDAILARLCVEAGAKKVYAIELMEQTYRQALAKVKSLGLEDKITLIRGDSRRTELPEKVDVCVSEIVGSIGGSEGAALIINDAQRFLKDGGLMIPQRSRTLVAAASLPDELLSNPGFSEISAHYANRIFEQVGHRFDLRLCIRNFPQSHLISEAGVFEELNFSEQVATTYRRKIKLRVTRKARWDGLLVWMNLHVGEGEVIDILEPGYSWFPIYFPLFYPGLEVDFGDEVLAVCSGELSANGINPDYRVEGKLLRRDGSEVSFEYESAHHEGGYRRTPFYRLVFGEDGAIRRREEREVTSRSLRAQLRRRLPEHMIPQSFLILDELPLTPSGKIDRRALPAPETIKSEALRAVVAPRTPLEQSLANMWSQLLGVEPVGIHDNFFELGGHSLLSTRLISHIRQAFAVELPLRRFFEIPTIAMLAAEIESLRAGDPAQQQQTAIQPLSRESRRMKRSAVGARKGEEDQEAAHQRS